MMASPSPSENAEEPARGSFCAMATVGAVTMKRKNMAQVKVEHLVPDLFE